MTPPQLQSSIPWPIPGGSAQKRRARQCAERLGLRSLLVSSLCLALLLAACAPPAPLPTPTPTVLPTPSPAILQAIDQGKTFLQAQYDPAVGLLEESPILGAGNFYLTEDNALAAHALRTIGAAELAAAIQEKLREYGHTANGFIEVAWGEPVVWPPLHQPAHHAEPILATVGDAQIRYVPHTGPGYYYDWSAYANLAFMAAVNEWNQGYREAARRLYDIQAGAFDGRGFADKAYWDRDGVYETLGLAWAVYAGALLCAPLPGGLTDTLLAQQDPLLGGFHTHFRADEDRLADANVETTSVALLALWTLAHAVCGEATAAPLVQPLRAPAAGAQAFLRTQYDPGVRLLRESPVVAPERHWLATDNRLAVYALEAAGDGLAPIVAAALAEYSDQFDAPQHGLIEALTGAPIAWPPRTHTHTELAAGVWHEERLSGVAMDDWMEYADLTLYGALEAWNRGDTVEARRRYAAALALFDGIGFADRARTTHYTTYKLALALWVGHRLGAPQRPDLLTTLLSKQDASGGFVSLYNLQGTPEGDANTETTSYALLALTALAR